MQHQHDEKPSGEHAHGSGKTELIFSFLAGALLLMGWAGSKAGFWPETGALIFYISAYFFGGYYASREVVENVSQGKFKIDFLMLAAASGAAVLGEWAEGAFLLFLFSLGHALESYALSRARNSIAALADLAPETALVRRNGMEQEVAASELVVGDIVIVRSNERIAADGFIIKGTSAINQAPITGESVPVDKQPVQDAAVARAKPATIAGAKKSFAGTINGTGSLEIEVTKIAAESTLSRIVEMVSAAEQQTSPTQDFTRKFERVFVPLVLLLVLVVAFSWIITGEPSADAFYRAMAVLVAASPCALAIATPSAILSGVARAAQRGVLVKGGAPLEMLGTIKAIAFDKTGTLTEGHPRLVDIVPAEGATEQELLATAVAVESLSDHPLAKAIVRDASPRLASAAPPATEFNSITGRGVTAKIASDTVHIGSVSLFSEIPGAPVPTVLRAEAERLSAIGRTLMMVRRGDRYLGIVSLMDTPRDAAAGTIARLRLMGISRMMMISGDTQNVADAVAREVGLDEAFGALMPQDKVSKIEALSAEQPVAMVGDGANDSPALARASVGIAMGAAGSDAALETADIALLSDDISQLPFAIGLGRATRRIIRQNLWASLGVVAFLIPATLLGMRIGPAILLHEGSTLIVVLNALRLLAFREASQKPGTLPALSR